MCDLGITTTHPKKNLHNPKKKMNYITNVVPHSPHDEPWEKVKNRTEELAKEVFENDQRKVKLCLALASYDHQGAPSNWESEFYHEDTICNWAEWVINEEEIDEEEIDEVIETHANGIIPDVFNWMIDCFT